LHQEQNKNIMKKEFYKLWLPVTSIGVIIILISAFTISHQLLLIAALTCYVGFSSWVIYSHYCTFSQTKEKLTEQSREDQLTGLKNRRYLEDRLNELLAKCKRDGKSFGLVFYDIDNFKEYNDLYGHTTGDKLLQQMAEFLLNTTREHETIARYGGDEFILLIPDSNRGEIQTTAKRIHRDLEAETFVVNNKNYHLKLSGGVAVCPEDGSEMDELLEAADNNLKLSKSKGNRVYNSNEKNRELTQLYPPLVINEKDDYLEKTGKENIQFYLLAKNSSLEIIKQNIAANNVIRLWGEGGNFEFYYLMEGELIQSENNKAIYPGSSITVQNLTDEVYFKTKTDCTFLYITTIPVFEDHQKQIRELLSLSRKAEKRDWQTAMHCLRLQKLSRYTGEILELNEEQLFALDYASALHDIGKAEIPAEILNKPGKLDEEEWKIIKQHPNIGRDSILDRLKRPFFKKVAAIVHQHHERHDGKGYPRGLSGNNILVEAQILSIVDAYDAMTSDRPYRKALDRCIALKELQDKKGTQFAPHAVEAFLKAEKETYRDLSFENE